MTINNFKISLQTEICAAVYYCLIQLKIYTTYALPCYVLIYAAILYLPFFGGICPSHLEGLGLTGVL